MASAARVQSYFFLQNSPFIRISASPRLGVKFLQQMRVKTSHSQDESSELYPTRSGLVLADGLCPLSVCKTLRALRALRSSLPLLFLLPLSPILLADNC